MAHGWRVSARIGVGGPKRWVVGVLAAALACHACGGLDDAQVTRGTEPSADAAGAAGTAPGSAGALGDGGADAIGGSSFEGGAPSLEGAPRVVAVEPAEDELSVEPDANVRVRFSEEVNESTLTSSSLQLWRGEARVSGKLGYEEGTATFEPDERLSLLAEYELRVTRDVQDAEGKRLEAAFSSRFTVREGAWTTEQPIIETLDTEHYWSGDVALGVDGAGNALTAWVQQGVEAPPSLMVRWHRTDGGWDDATPLYTAATATGSLLYLDASVSRTGEAAVSWFDQTPDGYALWVARYLDGEWQPPERAEGASGVTATSAPPAAPLVAINGERTIVAWLRQEFVGGAIGVYYYLEANDALHGQAFASEAQLAAANQGGPGNFFGWADLGMDAAGNALLVFSDFESDVGAIRYSKFAATTGEWTFDSPILGATPVRSGPFIRMSDEGNAVVVYDAGSDLSASHYTKAKGFSAPVVIDELDTQPYLAQTDPIATDGRQFVVTWQQQVGSTPNTYAAILMNDAWGPAELVSDGDVPSSGFPVPIADAAGNLTVVWSQAGPPDYDVYFSRRSAGAHSWQGPRELRVSTPRPYGNFRAAAGQNGMIGLALSVSYQSGDGRIAQPYFALFR